MRVFRQYELQELARQYDGALREPELTPARQAHAERMRRDSYVVRSTTRAWLDVSYGPHPRQRIDVFPSVAGPLLVFFHGGYWLQGSKDDYAWMAPAFVEAGIGFASVGYPLCPEVRVSDIVDSARSALAHLAASAERLGIDAARIHVAGHSAGGHLAAMVAAADRATQAPLVRSATLISGLFDLEPLRLVKPALNLSADDVEQLSPVRIAPGGAQVLLAVGTCEGAEFKRQTDELERAWTTRGARVSRYDAAGRYHFDILDELGISGGRLLAAVARMIVSP